MTDDQIRFSCRHCGAKIKVSRELSGRTGKCPKCGEAMTVPEQGLVIELQLDQEPPKFLVEKTSKRWKKLSLYGVVIIFSGLIFAIAFNFDEMGRVSSQWRMTIGLFVFASGMLTVFYSSIMSWWHHG